jgi:hypothetical protein
VLPFLNDHDVFPFLDYDLATLRDWINSWEEEGVQWRGYHVNQAGGFRAFC